MLASSSFSQQCFGKHNIDPSYPDMSFINLLGFIDWHILCEMLLWTLRNPFFSPVSNATQFLIVISKPPQSQKLHVHTSKTYITRQTETHLTLKYLSTLLNTHRHCVHLMEQTLQAWSIIPVILRWLNKIIVTEWTKAPFSAHNLFRVY